MIVGRTEPLLTLTLVLTLTSACQHPPASQAVEPSVVASAQPGPALVVETSPRDSPPSGRALLDGLPSIEAACERIDTVFTLPKNIQDYDKPGCYAEDAHLVGEDWGMLVVSYEYAEYYFPLVETEAGWSVDKPVLTTWSSGAEFNTELDEIVGEWRKVVPGQGEQLVIELAATLTQSHFDNPSDRFEHHRRKVLCMRERDTAWCTPAIISSIEVEEQVTSEPNKPHKVSSFTPEVRFEDGALLVAGADAKRLDAREAYDEDFLAYRVPAGRYPIEEVLGWPWPDSDWRR